MARYWLIGLLLSLPLQANAERLSGKRALELAAKKQWFTPMVTSTHPEQVEFVDDHLATVQVHITEVERLVKQTYSFGTSARQSCLLEALQSLRKIQRRMGQLRETLTSQADPTARGDAVREVFDLTLKESSIHADARRCRASKDTSTFVESFQDGPKMAPQLNKPPEVGVAPDRPPSASPF